MDSQPDTPKRAVWGSLGAVLLGWAVFFVLWSLFILGYVEGRVSEAVQAGALATGLSAVGGFVVWRVTGRFSWPEGPVARFLALHLLFAASFSVLWTALVPIVSSLIYGEPLSAIEWAVPVNSWRLLMGFWLYVILAGLSYVVRGQQRLRVQERKAAEATALAMQARLETLRGHLQPHFVFNALHSVMALVRLDPDGAEEVLERLGGMLRYATRDRESEFVALEEEWRFTRDYLELQHVRFGPRMTYSMQIEEGLAEREVPAFCLQPLAENAVVHGVGEAARGRIQVTARSEEGVLLLAVCDDGPGFKESEIQSGSGLRTLRERLGVLYGGRADLMAAREPSGGSCVTVRIEHQP